VGVNPDVGVGYWGGEGHIQETQTGGALYRGLFEVGSWRIGANAAPDGERYVHACRNVGGGGGGRG